MRTQFFKLFLPASVVAAMAVFAIPADAAQIECRIPFSFTVNDKTLPPGEYRVSTEAVDGVLFIRGYSDGAFALGNRLESGPETDAKLVFHKYGDQYILRQVWLGEGTGRELPQPSRERELMETAPNKDAALTFERVSIPAL